MIVLTLMTVVALASGLLSAVIFVLWIMLGAVDIGVRCGRRIPAGVTAVVGYRRPSEPLNEELLRPAQGALLRPVRERRRDDHALVRPVETNEKKEDEG